MPVPRIPSAPVADLSGLFSTLGPAGRVRGVSRQQRLLNLLRQALRDGRWVAGTRLPASRELAQREGMARNTVVYAYQQLVAEGWLLPGPGGTVVAPRGVTSPVPGTAEAAPRTPLTALPDGAGLSPGVAGRFSRRAQALMATAREGGSEFLPFVPGVPDLNAFPWRSWARHIQQAWGEVGARQLAYASDVGDPELRLAIAQYLRARRGLHCTPDQVLVTAGAQTALDLCARMLADPGDRVWMEHPGYPAAAAMLRTGGLRLEPVPVDTEGMVMDPDRWHSRRPRLVFVSPSHQYPMGSVLSLARRQTLLGLLRGSDAWVIEDDYDWEFVHSGRPLPPLQRLDPQAPVVYVGTFSKVMAPGLRLGYVVLPPWAVEPMSQGLRGVFRTGQQVEQRALARFIGSGAMARHLRRMGPLYARRQQVLRQELAQWFGAAVAVHGGAAGMHLTVVFAQPVNDVALVEAAAALGVSASPLSRYALPEAQAGAAGHSGLVLGYGMAPEGMIPSLVQRLHMAWRAVN